jgi:hypothetical protein
MEKVEDQQGMSQEDILKKKEEMMNFYKESMPYLKAQYEYEKMLSDIDEVRFKRTNIQYQMAMMMAQPEKEEEEKEEESTGAQKIKNKLRTK